ncbi:MAG: hypothetical protein JWM76_2219 [Pseudonocardiales bacterium]|nr:hypothetical protein [Pseudonocardiales bacterium]
MKDVAHHPSVAAEPTAEVAQRARPNPAEWLWYSWGGRLSPSLKEWVLKDTTGRTWAVRHVLRSLIYLAPFTVVILIFVPGEFWIRGVAVIGGTVMGLFFGIAYIVETTETRLMKAGYPRGLGESIRVNRSTDAHAAGVARRRAKSLERRSRRAGN